jgi:hypothetical protein
MLARFLTLHFSVFETNGIIRNSITCIHSIINVKHKVIPVNVYTFPITWNR